MAHVYLSLGSNVNRESNIRSCLNRLSELFGEVHSSSVYESEAVGFVGDHFYNLVVAIQTDLSVGELSSCLRQVEEAHGRDRNTPKFSARTLDIDILTYDDCVGLIDGVNLPRDEILQNAFVLLPFAEIAPGELHPTSKVSIGELWKQFDSKQQKLWKVDF